VYVTTFHSAETDVSFDRVRCKGVNGQSIYIYTAAASSFIDPPNDIRLDDDDALFSETSNKAFAKTCVYDLSPTSRTSYPVIETLTYPANVSAAVVLDVAVILFVDACCLLPVARIQKSRFILPRSRHHGQSIDNRFVLSFVKFSSSFGVI
jgi:hypothetical protein